MRPAVALAISTIIAAGGLMACHRAVPPNVTPPDVATTKAGPQPSPPPAPKKD